MSKQILIGGYYDLLNNAAVEYNSLIGGQPWGATEGGFLNIIPCAGTFRNFRVKLSTAPGLTARESGSMWNFALRCDRGGVITHTGISCSISGSSTTIFDNRNSFSAIPADDIHIQSSTPNAGDLLPTASYAYWCIEFEPSNPTYTIIGGGLGGNNSDSATNYYFPMGCMNSTELVEKSASSIFPTNGTISNLWLKCQNAPGAAQYGITLRKNGIDTALAVNLTTNKSGSDTSNTVPVVAGDVLTIKAVAGGNISNGRVSYGMVFTPDISGEAVVLGGTDDTISSTATEYNLITTNNQWVNTENQRHQLVNNCRIKKLYVWLNQAISGSTVYPSGALAFTVRDDLSSTALTATINAGGTWPVGQTSSYNDVDVVTVAGNSYIDMMYSGSGGAATAIGFQSAAWGFVILEGLTAAPTNKIICSAIL